MWSRGNSLYGGPSQEQYDEGSPLQRALFQKRMQGQMQTMNNPQNSIMQQRYDNWFGPGRGGPGMGFQRPVSRQAYGHTPEDRARYGGPGGQQAKAQTGTFQLDSGQRISPMEQAQRSFHPQWGGGPGRNWNFGMHNMNVPYYQPQTPYASYPMSQYWNPFQQAGF